MAMKIDNNCVVALQYHLSDADGNHIDSTSDEDPMVYLHGSGELIDGLENALQGKSAGEEFAVTLSPDEAYGHEDPELIRNYTMAEFNGVEMVPGMELQGKDPEGNFRLLRVVDVEGDDVTVNMNHPLCGMTLVFAVKIESVRQATETELAHGHAHGHDNGHEDEDGGHSH
jgi:FKBP-type peptidyl-prolyl cis-trans isomerase SlyD